VPETGPAVAPAIPRAEQRLTFQAAAGAMGHRPSTANRARLIGVLPMAEEKKEPWLNILALTTVILAVCATMATFKGGGYSTRSVMSQAQASDQWAFYQAKSVKSNLYEMSRANLELERQALTPGKGLAEAFDKKIEDYGQKVARYEGEKEVIQKKASALEKVRDDAQKHGTQFGIAVIYLQISILLSSIAALLKQKPVWLLGLAVGVGGLVYFINGFILLF
jgi:hypothetical protein